MQLACLPLSFSLHPSLPIPIVNLVHLTIPSFVPLNDLLWDLKCALGAGVHGADLRYNGRAPSLSVNWSEGDQELEVVEGVTGMADGGRPSRLCKRSLYDSWLLLQHQVVEFKRVMQEKCF